MSLIKADNVFDTMFNGWPFTTDHSIYPFQPLIHQPHSIVEALTESVSEDGTRTFSLDVPGFKKSDLSIELVGNSLTVSGKRGNRTVTLTRSLNAHYDIDTIKAHLEDGVLTVSYQTKKSKTIEITG